MSTKNAAATPAPRATRSHKGHVHVAQLTKNEQAVISGLVKYGGIDDVQAKTLLSQIEKFAGKPPADVAPRTKKQAATLEQMAEMGPLFASLGGDDMDDLFGLGEDNDDDPLEG